MRFTNDLAQAYQRLRDAAVDRGGHPRPGVSSELADAITAAVEDFRRWAVTAPLLIDPEIWDGWERRYAALQSQLPQDGPAGSLPKLDPDAPSPLAQGASAVMKLALAIALPIGLLVLLKRQGGR